MKRTISILFSALTLLVTVHTAMLFHFCSGRFVSVEFFKSQDINLCCCYDAETPLHNDTQSSVQTECCHTYALELSVDDFECAASVRRFAQPFQPIICHYAALIKADALSDYFTTDIISYAPLEHSFATGRELLIRICTLII